MMMSVSSSAVSFSLLAGLGVLAYTQGWFGKSTSQVTNQNEQNEPAVPIRAGESPVTTDLDGYRMITNGNFSMRVEGSSCGNTRTIFKLADGSKFFWNLKKVGTANVGGDKGIAVYTIESLYKIQNDVCNNRYLTAPLGCNEAPYLDRFRGYDNSQKWVFVSDGSGQYQLRSLLCTVSGTLNQYIGQSGNQNNSRPKFTAGSGTRFTIANPSDHNTIEITK